MDEPAEAERDDRPDRREMFEHIVESATTLAIFTMDADGIVTSWNVGAERLLGYAEAEIIGRSADAIFTDEDRAAGKPEAELAGARAAGRSDDERWHVRRDGTRFWASGQMIRLRNRKGFVKVLSDLTERHDAEEKLRQNEELFRVLATNVPQLVFRSQASGSRTWGSPQWIEFTGLDMEHSVRFGWLDAVHPDDVEATRQAWAAAMAGGDYFVEHRIFCAASRDYRWHQTRARVVGEQAAGPTRDMVGTSTDIHDLRTLQDRQRVLLAELQHRTRNLLAVVRSIAGQTMRSSGSLDEFEVEFSERLSALGRVQSLLARADHQAIDLRALVEAELDAHGDGRQVADKVLIEGPAVAVMASAAQALTLALHELATNAVKYGALGQPAGRLAITWRREPAPASRIVLDWVESGVALAFAGSPPRRGYGSELIERALPYQLHAETRLTFGDDGLRCRIAVPMATAVASGTASEEAPANG